MPGGGGGAGWGWGSRESDSKGKRLKAMEWIEGTVRESRCEGENISLGNGASWRETTTLRMGSKHEGEYPFLERSNVVVERTKGLGFERNSPFRDFCCCCFFWGALFFWGGRD